MLLKLWAFMASSWLGIFVKNVSDAAKYADGGYSWRKLFSIPCLAMAIKVTMAHTTSENLLEVLNSWLIFIGFILGLVTVQQVLQFRGAAPGRTETQTVIQNDAGTVSTSTSTSTPTPQS